MRRLPFRLVSALTLFVSAPALAAPTLRVQVTQRGDFALVGNTLAQDCASSVPDPVVGEVGSFSLLRPPCGFNTSDTAPDVFWRSSADDAVAEPEVFSSEARSTAMLSIPNGATVTHAYLYWAGDLDGGDAAVTLSRPGEVTFDVAATRTVLNDGFYHSSADVTSIVALLGSGAYRLANAANSPLLHRSEEVTFAGWWLVVLYEDESLPSRNLAVFDGLDFVDANDPQDVVLSGFLVPNSGFDAKLGVVTFEGDASIDGDELRFRGFSGATPTLNAADRLSDAMNPVDDFFNGTRSSLGAAVSVVGDLPQLTGTAGSMSSIDLDVVDITSRVQGGQTSAAIRASSTGDVYYLGGFVTSISSFAPDLSSSTKTVTDVNGGDVRPGDELVYTITVVNEGNDAAIDTQVADALPPGVTYVPGSLEITTGANAGAKTDAANDDQGEYVAATRTVHVRVGAGANATDGGTLEEDESSTIVFRVTVDADALGEIANQADITAAGEQGAPNQTWPTDGNGATEGAPPTTVNVDECITSNDCPGNEPVCLTTADPQICVACVDDSTCQGATPVCDVATNTCVGCTTDADCSGDTPACQPDGECGECSETNDDECGNGTTCDLVTGTCETDTDGDGLPDDDEVAGGTDPNDADSDDDGVRDGLEPAWNTDSDGDGLINALDPDSDDDGLFDGTELGLGCGLGATDLSAGACVADGDGGATTTDPLNADTDGGGANDGSEDFDLDGVVDDGETNPTAGNGADDGDAIDQDGDGISDETEEFLGTDPADGDSDDDGLPDGEEHNPSHDTDGDGDPNPLDADSDDDGLFDGTEAGLGCDGEATDPAAATCIADGDAGATTTSVLVADTDGGGVVDGEEDADHDGVVDPGERDPLDPADDLCDSDDDCGTDDDGLVCDAATQECVEGCRGTDGAGCPDDEVCSSETTDIGECLPAGEGGGGAGGEAPGAGGNGAGAPAGSGGADASDAGGSEPSGVSVAGGGLCSFGTGRSGDAGGVIAIAALLWAARRRKRTP